jgi:hypothetical protein
MPKDDEQRRQQAIARYLAGDKIADICRQMTCSKSWLYKWKARSLADDPSWTRERSRRPRTHAAKTPAFIAPAIIDLRHTLAQNRGRCGAAAIQQALQQQGIAPAPSSRTL